MADLSGVGEIYLAASMLPTATIRTAFLDAICGANRELREQVEARLAKAEAADTRSQVVLPVQPATAHPQESGPENPVEIDPQARERMGTIIGGRYTLVCQLGTGGMGTVWLAEQTTPILRRVAIKLIKPELVSNRVLARFDAERQALALMDHPNIAKVFDAGTTVNGRPFFVMELVEGTNLTEFCDARRLTIPERIELFLQVCRAIQHAHQKGIIHRDLKPSNILVSAADGTPIPRVIDFGLAKAIGTGILSDAVKSSTLGRIVGTPVYMSPEQATGSRAVDTRSDVYSLGVVLYELLTGTTPLEPARLKNTNNLEDVIQLICQETAPAPSDRSTISFQNTMIAPRRQTDPHELKRTLQGELDLIIMKAIAKNPEERYPGVAEFAAELERYLNQEPILALSGSRWYRFRKYTRRHRTAVIGGTAALLALLIGLASSTWGLVQAIETRNRAVDAEGAATAQVRLLQETLETDRKNWAAQLHETQTRLKNLDEERRELQKQLAEFRAKP